MGELERIPGIVVTGTSRDNPQGHAPTSTENSVDNFVNGAIPTHDDHRTPFLGGEHGPFPRFSLPCCLYILYMLRLWLLCQVAAHQCPVLVHLASIGGGVENHDVVIRGLGF